MTLRDIGQLQAEPQVGLVRPVAVHRLAVGHHGGLAQVHLQHLLPQLADVPAHDVQDVVAGHEAHLEVDLGELRLAVGPGILVAQALADLEVSVAPGDHEDLLEDLRALGQGVPPARIRPRGHDEVAGALRRGLDEQGCLDLQEPVLREEPARGLHRPVTRPQDLLHPRPPQIDVPVLEPLLLGDLRRFVLVGQDRRVLGVAEDFQLLGHDLDVARGQLRVDPAHPLADRPRDGNDVLPPQRPRLGDHGFVDVLQVEHDLRHPVTVPQVDEDQALALVAVGVDPTGQGDGLADVVRPQFAAPVCALQHGVRILGVAAGVRTGRVAHPIGRARIRQARPNSGSGSVVCTGDAVQVSYEQGRGLAGASQRG
jgi:hypothetical protein